MTGTMLPLSNTRFLDIIYCGLDCYVFSVAR
jgi:hypothetical protein